MNWRRKHLCEIASVCKGYSEDPELSDMDRAAFAELHIFAQRHSSLPDAGGTQNIGSVITKTCGVCQAALLHECSGRTCWQQPCLLMHPR